MQSQALREQAVQGVGRVPADEFGIWYIPNLTYFTI